MKVQILKQMNSVINHLLKNYVLYEDCIRDLIKEPLSVHLKSNL